MRPNSIQEYNLKLRSATVSDREGVIALIDSVYAEYNDSVCLEGADADLLALPDYYHRLGGEFWVLIETDTAGDQIVVGTHAAFAIDAEAQRCGFRRLYLSKRLRGLGVGYGLMQVALDWAWERGMRRIEFWSDVRFERAHRFFEGFGFRRDGRVREMRDGLTPYSEYYFYLDRADV